MYEIRPTCFGADDPARLRWPLTAGGANRVRLVDARRHHADHGVGREEDRPHVRPATDADRREPGFDHIAPLLDDIEPAPPRGRSGPRTSPGRTGGVPGSPRRRGEGLSPVG